MASNPAPLSAAAHLDALAARVDAIDAATQALAASLTAAERLRRPAPDRWGVADCFEHLIATGAAYYPRIAATLAADPPPTPERQVALAAAPYAPTWFGRWFVRSVSTGSRRLSAPRAFVPPPAREDAPERFLAQQQELRTYLVAARGRDLRALRVVSPISRLIVLRLGDCFALVVGHEERHLAQARAAVASRAGT